MNKLRKYWKDGTLPAAWMFLGLPLVVPIGYLTLFGLFFLLLGSSETGLFGVKQSTSSRMTDLLYAGITLGAVAAYIWMWVISVRAFRRAKGLGMGMRGPILRGLLVAIVIVTIWLIVQLAASSPVAA